MLASQVESFHSCFEIVQEPRVAGRCDHPLESILFLVVAAVISGADGPADIEDFGNEKQEWLEQFVEFPAGIPSHDTIGRLLALIEPKSLQDALLQWISELRKQRSIDSRSDKELIMIAIDGKTARGSYTDAGKTNALHIISAWATDHGVTLGQSSVDSKSNEITAIPELLKSLDLRNTIITLDALGSQKSIAKQIIDGKGDYTLAIKGNHPKLHDALQDTFTAAHDNGLVESGMRSKSTIEKNRGRLETRWYTVGPIPDELRSLTKGWANARSIGQAMITTIVGDKETTEVRYYISSRPPKVSEFSQSVRKHWGVESMHWILDVVFGEDSSRIRTKNATANMSFVRRFVTSLLKQDTSRSSLKAKRKRAGWNTDFLEKLMFG